MISTHRLSRGGHAPRIALIVGLSIAPSLGHATVRNVPAGYATIQGAIDASATGDSIAVAPGIYAEALTLSGKDVTLYADPADSRPIVTASDTARVLDIGAGVTAATEIVGLSFENGLAGHGGGMRCSGGASPRIRKCIFERNAAYQEAGEGLGGGLYIGAGSSLLIEDCSFLMNSAREFPFGYRASGGAVHCVSGAVLTVRRSIFYRNVSQGLEGGPGGAIAAEQADLTVQDCTFLQNTGGDGVAISAYGGLVVEDCEFRSNNAGYGNSAISWSRPDGGGTLLLRRSVFHDNSTITGATVSARGAGEIYRCTLAFNRGRAEDAALFLDGPNAHHNVVANNNGYGVESYDQYVLIQCSDVWGNLGGNYGPNIGDLTGILGNISEDPLFCDGASRNFRLQSFDSPCFSECGLMGAFGTGCTVDVPDPPPLGRIAFLSPVVPNPARDHIDLRIELARPMNARLTIVDAAGRRVATVADGPFAAGRHELSWRGAQRVRPGMYWAVLDADARQTRRFVILP